MICLQNLLTSLVLKNPIYTKVIDLFRAALRPRLSAFENSVDSLKDRRVWVMKQLNMTDWEIGRRIKEIQQDEH